MALVGNPYMLGQTIKVTRERATPLGFIVGRLGKLDALMDVYVMPAEPDPLKHNGDRNIDRAL